MSWARLIRRSLRFYWRTHLGVLGGVAISTAILVGALLVGDSVRASLAGLARARLGQVRLALHSPNRYQREALADELATELSAPTAPVLRLRGLIRSDTAQVNQVTVLGVDRRFWKLGPGTDVTGVALNQTLAKKLGIESGGEILLRVERPSVLSSDLPLSSDRMRTIAMRLTVSRIVDAAAFGRFSLRANQLPPLNIFVPLKMLQRSVEMQDRANMLLVGGAVTRDAASAALAKRWRLADAGLAVSKSGQLTSERIFLEPAVVESLSGGEGVLTYLANELRAGDKTCPYSMVAALGDGPDDAVTINEWLARDLGLRSGELTLTYYHYGPARQLIERSATFQIRQVIPTVDDRSLMPRVPGLTDAATLAAWDAPIPIDSDRIRPTDEAYWARYRGTPKAFISLAAGQRLWGNRFGTLTAYRSQQPAYRQQIKPAALGLFFRPVGAQAQQASTQGLDFGGLFIGLSFFLITAALILTALLFVFGVEQRRSELGLLLALGLPQRRLRRLWLAEGGVLALLGSLVGAPIGLAYGWLVLRGLATVWQGAVAGSQVIFSVSPTSLLAGPLLGTLVALGAIWLVVRKEGRAPARQLLAGETSTPAAAAGRPWLIGGISLSMLLTGLILPLVAPDKQVALFFVAGGLLLVGTMLASHALLCLLARGREAGSPSLVGVALRSATRRRGRSLAVISLLACASFLVIAVGANRKRVTADASQKTSGTGGFALYGESSAGISHDLGTAEGSEAYGLPDPLKLVQMRLREGDDASCLNLNRPQTPPLLGLPRDSLRGRFSFSATIRETEDPWSLLEEPDDDAIPAIGDKTTLQWALKKAVGDTLTVTDGQGRPLKLHIVGALDSSILQGSLLISETHFLQHYTAEQGYRTFLIEQAGLRPSTALSDAGLDLFSSTKRLANFNVVENTYLTIFQALGGLGLLLGTVGLGLVVSRNVLERRTELAQLRAVGFTRQSLRRMVLYEHLGLLAIGLLGGVVSALVAVLPALRAARDVPLASLSITMAAVAVSGVLWTWLASGVALRGDLLKALRNE